MNLSSFLRERSRGNPVTLATYRREIARFQGWLGTRALTMESVHEYEAYLAGRFAPNSLIPKVTAANLFLAWKGTDFRMRRPPKRPDPNPRLVKPVEYDALIARIADPEERLVVRVLHDSFLRPSDVVTLRLSELADEGGVVSIRKRTRKTGQVCDSILTAETAAELRAYIASKGVTDYIFAASDRATKNPHRERTWPNKVLSRHGAGFGPRTFRRTGATNWGADLTSLMSQGGWTDPKTILTHYRRDVRERHLREFEKSVGPAREHNAPTVPSMEGADPSGPTPPPSVSHRIPRGPEIA